MKILMVDDEPLFIDLISKYLNDLGYHDVTHASSGHEALALIECAEEQFDCFLLDIRMPGMSGVELCRNIRKAPEYAFSPIVMITSMTEKSFVDAAFKAGANDYVTKPIDRLEIDARMGMVKALVAERAQAGQLLQKLDEAESNDMPAVDFDTPIILDDADFLMPFSSLENYLLRLGNLRLMSSVAVGFHVVGGAEIHRHTSALEFSDILSEVALAIQASIIADSYILSYSGGGNFCGVFMRKSRIEIEDLETQINDSLSNRLSFLEENHLPVPSVSIGLSHSNSILSFKDPTYILYNAISASCKQPQAEPNLNRSKLWEHIRV